MINLCGSALFYWYLQFAKVAQTSSVVNALTLVFTALTGYILGEKLPDPHRNSKSRSLRGF